jgi:Zn-dependent protease
VASLGQSDLLRNIVLYLVPMVLSLSVHEFAHAFVATRLGDDTPAREERLTLSPLAHVDVFGTLIVPLISIVTMGQAFIGWAKPVNIDPSRFRQGVSMRRGMALSSAAGPLSNLALAVIAILLLVGLSRPGLLDNSSEARKAFAALLQTTFFLNIGLCVFNLLPLPPLDGHRLLPRSLDPLVEKIRPFSFMIIMVVLMMPPLRAVLIQWPIQQLGGAVLALAGVLAG